MRILLANSHGADTSVGGAERYVDALAGGLRARGHDVAVLAAFPGPPADVPTATLRTADWRASRARRVRNHLGDLVSVPTPRLARAVREHRPELVHTNNLPGLSTAVWEAARRLGVPVVHSLHDYYLLCPRVTLVDRDGHPCCPHARFCALRTHRLTRWSGGVTEIIGVSRFILERHRPLFPTARGHVIHHPAAAVETRPLPPPTSLRNVGFIGSLEATKGVRELVKASAALAGAGVGLHVAGDGRLRPEVESAAAAGTLVYYGTVAGEAKRDFFATCDVGIAPSVWPEPGGPPYVVLEWLAAGRPVLLSTRGGLAERLDEFPGLVPVEPNAAAIVAAVAALRNEERFTNTVASVRRLDAGGETDRWLDEHDAVYRAAIAAAERRV